MNNVKIGNKNRIVQHMIHIWQNFFFNQLTNTNISDTLCCDMIDCDQDDFYCHNRG